jgi:hypothetical protein
MSRTNDFLFSQWPLRTVLESQESALMKEIEGIGSNQLLNTSAELLCEYFENKYKLDPIRLKESEITVGQAEKKMT